MCLCSLSKQLRVAGALVSLLKSFRYFSSVFNNWIYSIRHVLNTCKKVDKQYPNYIQEFEDDYLALYDEKIGSKEPRNYRNDYSVD